MRAYIAIASFAAVAVLGFAGLASAREIELYKLKAVQTDLNQFFDAGDKKIKAMADGLFRLAEIESGGRLFRLTFSAAAQLMNSLRTTRRRRLTGAIQNLKGSRFDHELSNLLSTAEQLNEELDGRINNLFKIAQEHSPANHYEIIEHTAATVKILHDGLKHIEDVASQGEKYESTPGRSRMEG